ncbi:MAG: DUF389 domain-containing protein [Bacteroidales bacterium]|nr:DUF389 domain-containing protein [Bacteroidales bacterium]
MNRIVTFFKRLVNMSDHLDLEGAGETIRRNVPFRGPTVFILACAIVIASVGLNVNSIPVIIGAMLISPVMGPILGFGFGLGTRNRELVTESLKHFAVMVGISILASTLFFILSPLNLEHPTELLARTKPTVYDVLIALFGGIAGILEISRKEKGTVLSGVAIATALMPPLCTVGYGLSILKWSYVAGALYLFLINSIFIALATFAMVKYLHFPVVSSEDGTHFRMKGQAVGIILLIIIVPSVLSAIQIVRESNFKIHAARLVNENKVVGKSFIYDYKVDFGAKPPVIELFVAGEEMTDSGRQKLFADAVSFGIPEAQIILREDAARSRDILSDSEIIQGIYEHNDRQILALTDTVSALRARLDAYKEKELPVEAVFRELAAQYPTISSLILTRGTAILPDEAESEKTGDRIIALLSSSEPLQKEAMDKITRWLQVRLGHEQIIVLAQ